MKSEPETYSIDQMKKDQTTWWEGVRNYQARNFMTKEMQLGDLAIFYHSNATPPCAVGIVEVNKLAQPDRSAMDPKSDYYDPKATTEKPIWECVEVKYQQHLKRPISLEEMRASKKLSAMRLLQKGNRLSILPLSKEEFLEILRLGGLKKP